MQSKHIDRCTYLGMRLVSTDAAGSMVLVHVGMQRSQITNHESLGNFSKPVESAFVYRPFALLCAVRQVLDRQTTAYKKGALHLTSTIDNAGVRGF